MDVGDDRHGRRADDLLQRCGGILIGAGYADDVGPRLLAAADLVDRRRRVAGGRVGHGLLRDGRTAPHRHIPDHDLTRLAARVVAPRTDGPDTSPLTAGLTDYALLFESLFETPILGPLP